MENLTATPRNLKRSRISLYLNFPIRNFVCVPRYPVWRCVDLSKMRLTRWSLTRYLYPVPCTQYPVPCICIPLQAIQANQPRHYHPGQLSSRVSVWSIWLASWSKKPHFSDSSLGFLGQMRTVTTLSLNKELPVSPLTTVLSCWPAARTDWPVRDKTGSVSRTSWHMPGAPWLWVSVVVTARSSPHITDHLPHLPSPLLPHSAGQSFPPAALICRAHAVLQENGG